MPIPIWRQRRSEPNEVEAGLPIGSALSVRISLPTPDAVRTRPFIVVGFDAGPTSMRAAAYAAGVAARQGSRLLFVQVWEMPTGHGLLPLVLPIDHDAAEAGRVALLPGLRDLIGGLSVDWELRQVIGSPRHELRRVAREVSADGVIVGTSRRVHRHLLGSIGSGLARAGDCPVTVVP